MLSPTPQKANHNGTMMTCGRHIYQLATVPLEEHLPALAPTPKNRQKAKLIQTCIPSFKL